MRFSKGEQESGYRAAPLPPTYATPILRRIGAGHLLITMRGGKPPVVTYDDGTPVMLERTEGGVKFRSQMEAEDAARWAKNGWLIAIQGETLIPDGPPQRYRARTPADPPLPKVYKNGAVVR